MTFAELVKDLRIRRSLTLRQFCVTAGIDPSNWSKVERGVNPPPGDARLLAKIAGLLELGPEERQTFMDLADIGRRELPADITDNPVALRMLPAFFRAARGHQLNPGQFDEFTEEVRKLHTPDPEY